MIAMEDWVTIKTLKAKNPSMSLREIGRLIQISPHTVKSALESAVTPSYERTSPSTAKLEMMAKDKRAYYFWPTETILPIRPLLNLLPMRPLPKMPWYGLAPKK